MFYVTNVNNTTCRVAWGFNFCGIALDPQQNTDTPQKFTTFSQI